MNERVMRVCEFNKVKALLSEEATSSPGRELCLSLVPMSELEEIEKAQSETASAVQYLNLNSSISFGSTRDFKEVFASLQVGHTLSIPELIAMASFLENVAQVKNKTPKDENDPLFDLFDCLVPLSQTSSEIRRCIEGEEKIADDASPALKSIRRDMRLTDDRMHAMLGKMLNQTYASYLQDNIITMRDDRYCLPIRCEYKNQVRGIVHDQSSSGNTLFIEPAAIVELGNTMRELTVKEKKEEEKILSHLSSLLSDHLIVLRDNVNNMATLDFIFAKAKFAIKEDAIRPVMNHQHVIKIYKGRHPLIDKEKVVPIDLSIGEEYDTIVITGPNTGGKTVSLKTAGLFELMGMSGLHIPAGEPSELSIFREVYADIGDEQSIEQNLSTFSSHMSTIVDILRRADKKCLCLLDELGSGTDPTEGAALAISILNFLHTRKITTLATTHYAELKLFASRTKGVINASCEFDVETLQPTYKLLVGVPGKSNAFAISKKLGLPGYIIETAKEQLSQETQNYEDVLSKLEKERQNLDKEKEASAKKKTELDRREAKLKQQEKEIQAQKQKILDEANEKARNILQDAKNQADSAISSLRKSSQKSDVSSMEHTRTSLREKVATKNEKLTHVEKKPKTKALRPQDLHLGDQVFVLSMKMEASVTRLPDRQNRVGVQIGIMNSVVPLSDLALVSREEEKEQHGSSDKNAARRIRKQEEFRAETKEVDLSRISHISPELNLLGMTVDEALIALDKYLDDARMSHLDSVRIVHGKGTGALRNAVQNYLRKQTWIRSFRTGEFGEGDSGVTIVEL